MNITEFQIFSSPESDVNSTAKTIVSRLNPDGQDV